MNPAEGLGFLYMWGFGFEIGGVNCEMGFRTTDGTVLFDDAHKKWAQLDSNQRPMDYESTALTAELRARASQGG